MRLHDIQSYHAMRRALKIIGSVLCALCVCSSITTPVHAASVVVSIPESDSIVKAGERVYFQIDFLYPDNQGRHDFTIAYNLAEGEAIIASAQVIKAVETQASFSDYMVVPANAGSGLHTIRISITDDHGASIASGAADSFQVQSNYDWATIEFFILLAAILLVGGIVVIDVHHALWRVMRGRS